MIRLYGSTSVETVAAGTNQIQRDLTATGWPGPRSTTLLGKVQGPYGIWPDTSMTWMKGPPSSGFLGEATLPLSRGEPGGGVADGGLPLVRGEFERTVCVLSALGGHGGRRWEREEREEREAGYAGEP